MFQDLYAVARHTPLTLIVTPQGDKLSVIVTPHPGKDGAKQGELSKPIQAVGTPAELDAELPAKLREYAEAVNGLRLKLDLPTEAVAAAAAKAKPARSTPAPKAKKPAKARPAKKPAAKPRVKLPGATKAKKAPTPRAGLPTREDLVVACRELIAKHGVEKVDRAFFIKHVKGGRRYERLFESFREMVELTKATVADTPPVETPASPPPAAEAEATPGAAYTALRWPFPTGTKE